MQQHEAVDEISTPGENGYDVVGQGEVDVFARITATQTVAVVEGTCRVVDVAEQEEAAHHHAELIDGKADDAFFLDEVVIESLSADGGHVEQVGSHPYAHQHRSNGHDGHKRTAHKVESPGVGNVVAFLDGSSQCCGRNLGRFGIFALDFLRYGMLFVFLQQEVDARDGLYGSQLIHPPNHDLHCQQNITGPRNRTCHNHGNERYDGINHVALGQSLAVLCEHAHLPPGEAQQQGRIDEVHQGVGHEQYAEHHNEECHAEEGKVEHHTVLQLLGVQTDEQRHQEGLAEPSHVDEQRGGHADEVAIDETAHKHQHNGKEQHTHRRDNHTALLAETVGAEAFRNAETQDDVAHQGGNQQIEKYKHGGAKHNGTAPFRTALFVCAQRNIFFADVAVRRLKEERQIGECGEIVAAAVDEDALLQGTVSLQSIIVERLHLL